MTETHAAPSEGAPAYLSRLQIFFLAVASAIVVANAYYIHTIISMIADAFGISDGMIGIVPAFNQIALALGIFLVLPLGDLISNRRLTIVSVALQAACVALMAIAPSFSVFLAASTILGFFTIAPYLLPAYASKRVAPSQLGYVTAVLTTGIIIGILVARAGAGIVAEQVGWRWVYYGAATLMIAVTLVLPKIMAVEPSQNAENVTPSSDSPLRQYLGLLTSIVPIALRNPEVLISGAIQGLGFGTFLVVWMGIGLHVPGPEMGYGVDTVGYLALLAIVSMVTTPWFGRWADRIGPRRARIILASLQSSAILMLFFVGHSIWLMILPIVMTNMFGPSVDVTGRMTFLSQAPHLRTRFMTIYIVLMFLGGGLGSWVGTASYAAGGWTGMASSAAVMTSLMLAFSIYGFVRYRERDAEALAAAKDQSE